DREEAVTSRVELLAAKARELATDEDVVVLQQVAPRSVAELRGAFRGGDDVGEHHGREHGVRHRLGSHVRDERLDLSRERLEDLEAAPLDLERSRAFDPYGEI